MRALEVNVHDLVLRRIPSDTSDPLAQALALGVEEGLLAINGGAFSFSRRRIVTTRNGLVDHASIVPHCHAPRLPLPAHSQVVGGVEVLA